MIARGVNRVVLLLICAVLAGEGLAQRNVATDQGSYRIGPGDILSLNVPAEPDLERELTVQPDSTVYVPQVGKVTVGGLTVNEAEEILAQRLRLFNPDVDAVVLFVSQYNALQIYVLGAVANPGTYTFSSPPSLWDVLRAAGGPTGEASLSNARVIGQADGRQASTQVNLSGYLSGTPLPPVVLNSGDTLVVPSIADGAVGVPAEDGVQVFGGVATPTTVPLTEPAPLLSVLMLAGAPAADAKLSEVDWVHRDPGAPQGLRSRRIDMNQYLREGKLAGNPLVYPGDALYVGRERPGWLRENLPLFLAIITTTTTVLYTVDRLSE